MPPPIGYICALTDPDGNVVEFCYDQGVYAKAQEVWGDGDAAPLSPAAVCVAYLAAFATGDPELVAAHVTDDFVNEHTAALGEGSRRYRRVPPPPSWASSPRCPDLRYEIEDVVADGDRVVRRLHAARPGQRTRRSRFAA